MRTLFVILMAFCVSAGAAERSSKVRREFQLANPCPSTGKTTGPCVGWVKDHRIPICAGGPDTIENLMWQEVEEAKRKDRLERSICRRLRQCSAPVTR